MKVVLLGAKNPETRHIIDAILDYQKKAAFHDEEAQCASESGEHGSQFEFHGFIDNDQSRHGLDFVGLPVFGGFEVLDDLIAEGCVFINIISRSTVARYETSKIIRNKGGRFVNLIHPSVRVSKIIGVGNYIQEGVVVQSGVEIGNNSAIHAGAMITHQTKIGNSTFIAPSASICGEVTIGDGVFVGTNATILPRLKIGNWATIGAGAVVFNDVPERATFVGNPARILCYNNIKYLDGDI
jgi:sugar O-acyltransferase (sialic acid O-acetyltransferase NeuD family)